MKGCGYVIAVWIAVSVGIWVFGSLFNSLHPFLHPIGSFSIKVIKYLQWDLWMTAAGNVLFSGAVLLFFSIWLFKAFRSREPQLQPRWTMDIETKGAVIHHILANKKRVSPTPYTEIIPSIGPTLMRRITLWILIFAALAAVSLFTVINLNLGIFFGLSTVNIGFLALPLALAFFFTVAFHFSKKNADWGEGGRPRVQVRTKDV